MPSLDLGKVVGEQGPVGPVAQGSMLEAIYDPNSKARDVFAYADAAATTAAETAKAAAIAEAAVKAAAAESAAKAASAQLVHASQHASGGTDPITPADIGAAASVHASRHASGGADPITPSAIGAVKKTGDTMTGNLTISRAGYSTMILKDTTVGSTGVLQHNSHITFLGTHNEGTDTNRRQILLRDKVNRDGLKEALQLGDVINGTHQYYNILHTGNKELISFSATATVGTNWTASGSYYYQDITVSGLLATDAPIVDINPGSDNDANLVYADCISKVFRATASANSLRLWATEAISTAFPIQLKVVR